MTNFLVTQEVPQAIVEAIKSTIESKWIFLLALNIFLLVVGCMMDIFSAIVIVVPLIAPLAVAYGVHPIHLAIIFMVNLEVGYSTPPVGLNLFIASFRFRQPIIRLYKAALPFVILALVALAAVTYIEPLSTFTVPESGATIEGGMGGSQPPADSVTPKPKAGAPVMDGICDEKLKGDPDCEDDDLDEELEELDKEDEKEKSDKKEKE
jgi:hypothetical protein